MTEPAKAKARLIEVQSRIAKALNAAKRTPDAAHLIAVSKTHPVDAIKPLIALGQRRFGENRVQEAQAKWPDLKRAHTDIELHLIGPLQSNKTKEAVALFDVVHTIDREKIARKISQEMATQQRNLKLFIQVNTGDEPQKAGINLADVDAFTAFCTTDLKLKISGLMCIPPVNEEPSLHFALLAKIARHLSLSHLSLPHVSPLNLSMGMSADYETAIALGATHVRVGTALFGARS